MFVYPHQSAFFTVLERPLLATAHSQQSHDGNAEENSLYPEIQAGGGFLNSFHGCVQVVISIAVNINLIV